MTHDVWSPAWSQWIIKVSTSVRGPLTRVSFGVELVVGQLLDLQSS